MIEILIFILIMVVIAAIWGLIKTIEWWRND